MSVDHFETLLREQTRMLLPVARMLTGNVTDAEDLVQETLIAAHQRRGRVAGAENRQAYMRRMLVNQHLSGERKQHLPVTPLQDSHEHADTDADTARQTVDRDALGRMLARLPVRERTVVVLRHYLQYQPTEIAEALDLEASTVRSLLSRALASLRTGATSPEHDSTMRSTP